MYRKMELLKGVSEHFLLFLLSLYLHIIHIAFFWSYISFDVLEFINAILNQQIESNNEVVSVYSLDAEFARPLWIFGMNSYEFVQSHGQKELIACSYRSQKNNNSYFFSYHYFFIILLFTFTFCGFIYAFFFFFKKCN